MNNDHDFFESVVDLFVSVIKQDGGRCGFCGVVISSSQDLYHMVAEDHLLIGCSECSSMVVLARFLPGPGKITPSEVKKVREYLKFGDFESDLEEFLKIYRKTR